MFSSKVAVSLQTNGHKFEIIRFVYVFEEVTYANQGCIYLIINTVEFKYITI